MIDESDFGELPNQSRLGAPLLQLSNATEPSSVGLHRERWKCLSKSMCKSFVIDLQKQPAANSFEPHQQSHVIRSSPCFPEPQLTPQR
jgi:hypothetical protein